MRRTEFKLVRDPSTSELRWAPNESNSFFSALAGWLVLAVSTVLFLLVTAYIAYAVFLARPSLDPSSIPDRSGVMREGVHQLDRAP